VADILKSILHRLHQQVENRALLRGLTGSESVWCSHGGVRVKDNALIAKCYTGDSNLLETFYCC
jgi:hypothetical protein